LGKGSFRAYKLGGRTLVDTQSLLDFFGEPAGCENIVWQATKTAVKKERRHLDAAPPVSRLSVGLSSGPGGLTPAAPLVPPAAPAVRCVLAPIDLCLDVHISRSLLLLLPCSRAGVERSKATGIADVRQRFFICNLCSK